MKKATFKCHNCGHEFTWNHANAQNTVNRGIRYICSDCATIDSYGSGNDLRVHGEKKHGFTIGFELECVPKSHTDYCSMISEVYNLRPTEDCSLPYGGVEFNTPVYRSMSGIKQLFRSFEKHVDFNYRECGSHINIGHSEHINRENIETIIQYRHELLEPLMKYLENNTDDTIKIFGRNFGYYRTNRMACVHGDWINLEGDNRIEFRLAKFVNATQYLWLTFLCRDIVEIIIKSLFDNNNGKSQRTNSIKAGEKIVKLFKKYADGKANCQRPERNSKAA